MLVHPAWVDLLKDRFGKWPYGFERMAKELNATARTHDLRATDGKVLTFSRSQLGRAFKDSEWTREIVAALCTRLSLLNPLLVAASDEEVAWFLAGRTLRELDPPRFQTELARARALAEIRSRQREIDAEDE